MGFAGGSRDDRCSINSPEGSVRMTKHPILDLAALFARIFVIGMSITAVVAALVLVVLAVLL
jgi:hypothetical protein